MPPASLRRNRDYVVLVAGQTVSAFGSGMSNIALPLLVLALTGSPAQAAFVSAAEGLPLVLLSLPAGALVDRWNRKRLMIVCDTGRALALGSVPLAAVTGHLSMAQLYVVAMLEGTLALFFGLAEIAAIPRAVPREQLRAATAQQQALGRTASLVSPSIGGLLFQTLGKTIPYLVDAISYIGSVISLFLIRIPLQEERTARPRVLWRDMLEGVQWLWTQPLLRFLAFLGAAFMFTYSGTPLIIILLAKQQHASTGVIGAIFSIEAIGGIIGATIAQRAANRFTFTQAIIGMEWLMVIITPLFAISPNAVALGAVAAAIGLTSPIYNVIVFGYRIALVPNRLQGRVNSVYRLVALGFAPLGLALTGILLQTIGPKPTVLLEALAFLALAVVVSLHPVVRSAPEDLSSQPA